MGGGTGTDIESLSTSIIKYPLIPSSFIRTTNFVAEGHNWDLVDRIVGYSTAGILEASRLWVYTYGAYEIGKRVVEYL